MVCLAVGCCLPVTDGRVEEDSDMLQAWSLRFTQSEDFAYDLKDNQQNVVNYLVYFTQERLIFQIQPLLLPTSFILWNVKEHVM